MSGRSHKRPASRSWCADEADVRRLFARVRDARSDSRELPTRLEAALRTALAMFSADPEFARRLTVDSHLGADQAALDAQREWMGRFGKLLDAAAASDPRASREPSFLAPFLIGGVRFQIARHLSNGEASDLSRLLPSFLEGLLSYYFEPGEPRRLAEAALAADHLWSP